MSKTGVGGRSAPHNFSVTGDEDELWVQYKDRYAARPETLRAYVDVWRRLTGARSFSGGFSGFSQAANAEPKRDPDHVRRAEELMRLGGYECGPKLEGIGRRWRKPGAHIPKYDALTEHLASIDGAAALVLTFTEVGQIVGGLPPSAFRIPQWWANDSKDEARAWRAAGWHVDHVDLNTQRVRFARGRVGGARAKRLGWE